MKKITCLLALPRISRNGNFYFPEELAKADGKTVPLRWNHIQDNEGIIGTAKLIYDQEKMQINYEATVENEAIEQQLGNKEFKVSLGAEPQKEERICHDEGKCYNVPLGLDFKEMSIVETPGIPEATLDVIEYFTTESVKFEDCVSDCLDKKAAKSIPVDDQAKAICHDECEMVEAVYQGRTVTLNKPFRTPGESKKFAVYVQDGENVKIVRFGDPNMSIKRSNPDRKSSFRARHNCDSQKDKTSAAYWSCKMWEELNENTSDNTSNKEISMAEETETKVTVDTKEVPAEKPVEAPQCPEGQTYKDGTCVPEAPAPEAPKAPEAVVPAPTAQVVAPQEDCGCSKETKAEETNVETEINAKVEAKLESIQDEIRENYAPKAKVEENAVPKGYVEEGVDQQVEDLKKVLKGNSVVIEIDKEDFYQAHTVKENSPVTEAVSTSGTIPTVSAQRDIIVLPGGISVKPVRQWTQFKEIPQGNDKVRFYKIDIPAFGDITEGGSDISASTHTLTSIDVAADTPRGMRQVVKKTEIEKYPSGLLEAIRSTARLRAIQDEASIILKDVAAPAAATSGTNTFVAGAHLSASDGTDVTSTTLEDATGEFLKEGVEFGRQALE